MRFLLLFLVFFVAVFLPLHLAANTKVVGLNLINKNTLLSNAECCPSDLECCPPERICIPDDKNPSNSSVITILPEKMMKPAQVYSTPVYPIYIDSGVRYDFSKSNFSPVYQSRVVYIRPADPCRSDELVRVTIKEVVGYEMTVRVEGDDGKMLFFDVFGRSDQSLKMSASCGSFNAQDSGSKWAVSKQHNTNGSCNFLKVQFTYPSSSSGLPSNREADFLDFSVIISQGF
ncbi:hypothetical protein BB427_03275 [Pseudoalteromonas sp. BMB]|uniref:hypothetical protein n=1 Tax=Pseudoalteromonas sp. BMB TaxID=1874619 RepID=UPI00083E4821|nr:hypothetical protein [Pseudoalteromonas sp. BMB]ODB35635.1 hypothetical protein BB427_03275 [Pseudoalteromonas sp. BMB]